MGSTGGVGGILGILASASSFIRFFQDIVLFHDLPAEGPILAPDPALLNPAEVSAVGREERRQT